MLVGHPAGIKLVGKEELMKEKELKKKQEEAKHLEKEKKKAEQAALLEQKKVKPSEMFLKETDKYSLFDDKVWFIDITISMIVFKIIYIPGNSHS